MSEKLFLHICCAPCACFSADFFRREGFESTGFWYNPNIHPLSELERRKSGLDEYSKKTGLEVVVGDHSVLEDWLEETRPGWSAKDRELRCSLCYRIRMSRTVVEAKKRGFVNFSTTLLYSRYQFHDRIVEICRGLAKEHGLNFVYFDLRQGWQKGIEISKKMGLYRQRYCSCLFSEAEAKGK